MSNSSEPDEEGEPPGTVRAPDSQFQKRLESLKAAIWAKRPVLQSIMEKHGEKMLFRYTQDFLDVNKSPRLDARKEELIGIAQELVSQRLGDSVGKGMATQLRKFALVSTADHHGPIVHPLFVNANLISALPYFESSDPDLRYLVVLSFASVSVNNASAYPRGIEFHGGMNGSGNFIRLPILPDKLKMGVVYGTRSFTREDLTKAEQQLIKKENGGEIAPGRGDKIRAVMEENFGASDVLASRDLSSQITEINYRLWPKLFHGGKKKMPDLIYLEIETLVTELLIRYHFKNPNSLLYRILFDPKYVQLVLQHFNNLAGGFSLENKWGTHLFWALDEKSHRVRLELNSGKLFSENRGMSFDLNPEQIGKGLREKKIFPSMLLCYLMVSLYYGMKCLGGFCQVHDLTVIKEAWGKLLREVGESDEADAIIPVQTKELGGDGLVLTYLKTMKGEFVPATGIDMAVEEVNSSFEYFVSLSREVTLQEMMNPMLPEIYTVLFPAPVRDQDLLKLTPEEILSKTGLDKKIKPCAYIT